MELNKTIIKLLSLTLIAVIEISGCGKKENLSAGDVLYPVSSDEPEQLLSADSISANPVISLGAPVEKIKDTVIENLPFTLNITDHGNKTDITDGYYKNALYEKMKSITSQDELIVNQQLGIDILYAVSVEGILVDFDYGDGTNTWILIHDKYSNVVNGSTTYLLPAVDAEEIRKLLVEAGNVAEKADVPDPGVGTAVNLLRDTGYNSLHPYSFIDMRKGKISTIIIKNDSGEATFVENNDTNTVLKAFRDKNDEGDRWVDITGLSNDDLDIHIEGAEPYFYIEYDTGYGVEISTGYDLTVNCDKDGNIILKDVYAGDNLYIKYTIPKESYKYCEYETFSFNGIVMGNQNIELYLKDGYFQIYGPDIANGALSATPGSGSKKRDVISDYVTNTNGNYIFDLYDAQ